MNLDSKLIAAYYYAINEGGMIGLFNNEEELNAALDTWFARGFDYDHYIVAWDYISVGKPTDFPLRTLRI